MSTATVIIPTTGADTLADAIGSVIIQTHKQTDCWVIIDGPQFEAAAKSICDRYKGIKTLTLLDNTGGGGFYGHRIYAAASFLINSDYVLYLDQDNWFGVDHVATMIDTIETKNLDWAYSLRRIHDKDGNFLVDDNCESLGKWPIFLSDQHFLVDTSCYCVKRDVITRIGGAWYGGYGNDRNFYAAMKHYFPNYGTTGRHSVCYRLDGNPKSVNADFFQQGNAVMSQKYGGSYPWHM